MVDLVLSVEKEYWDAFNEGTKFEEYRRVNDYWSKRIVGKHFDTLVIQWGYPKLGEESRRRRFPYNGYSVKTITHPVFGSEPAEVFAIRVLPYKLQESACVRHGE